MKYNKYILGLCFGLVLAATLSLSANSAQAASYIFTRDLTIGSTGTDVFELQKFLNSKGFLVATVGAGSPGSETTYFGSLTQGAVSRYQAANGITPIAGYFGPITRGHVNATPSTPTQPSNPGNNDQSLNGGDGDFRSYKLLGSPSNKHIEEGGEEEVLGFEFDADDSDLRVERLDVQVAGNGNTERPWRYIDSLVLYDEDHDEIATVDASDSDNWDEQSDDHYEITFDDIDKVVRENDTARFYVAVVAKDSIDNDDLPKDFEISVSDDGIRALNAEGINVYEGNEDNTKNFTFREAQEGQLNVTVDESDNDDKVVDVDQNDDTEDVVLYTAQLKSDDGDNDIDEVTVDLSSLDSTSLSDMINTLYLYIDGDEVGSESVDSGTTDSVTFDDIDKTIDEDDKVDVEVRADVNSQEDNYTSGSGVQVNGVSVDFTDQNDDDQTETDSTDGGEITFSIDALNVTTSNQPSAQSPVANDESKGRFFVEFKVTAPDDDDIYIPKGATTSTNVASGQGAEFIVIDGSGNQVSADTSSANSLLVKVSGGSESGNYYKVSSGNTATFRLDVIVDNDSASEARTLGVQLTGINYRVGSASTANMQYTAGLDEDYQSDTAYLLNENTSN